MKVLDIIKSVCAYIGNYNDYINYFEPSIKETIQDTLPNQISLQELSDNSEEIIPDDKKQELSLLILAINNIQEKILKTINLVTVENVVAIQDKIEISNLSKKIKNIISVCYKGKKLKFKKIDNYIKVYDLINYGEDLEIKYSYFLPFVESLKDDINLEGIVSERTISLGVASEYCSISGLFDDAEIWDKKFLQELQQDSLCLKNFSTPKRNWR